MIERDPSTGLAIFRPDGRVLREFMRDTTSAAKVIQGPIGSGKTLASIMSIWMKALSQVKQADGWRRCRAHIFRDTYGKLKDTTLKSWLEWFPEAQFGKFYASPPLRHEIRCGDVWLDVHFIALEDEWAADYFRSLETTICWFNELQYMDRLLFDEAVTRVGRYPRVIDGGAIAPQVIADMNAPAETHWVPIMRGDVAVPDYFTAEQRRAHEKPPSWAFFTQPAGLIEVKGAEGEIKGYRENPLAENLKYLPGGSAYYLNAIQGKTKAWIDANVLNRVSPRRDGKPVLRDFERAVHVAKQKVGAVPGVPLQIGCDFGRRPCAIIGQYIRGQWYVVHELIGRDMGADKFAPLLRAELAQHFNGYRFQIWGDPSGDFKGQNDDNVPFRIFRQHKMPVIAAPSFLFTVRLQSIEAVLTRMSEGKPALLISPTCSTLIAALDGGWHYRRIKVAGEKYADEPEKDEYCMPLTTEALTPSGWKKHDELQIGDEIYSFDMTEQRIVRDAVQAVNVFPDAREITQISGDHCRIESTARHRHIVETKRGVLKIVTTNELNEGHSLICAASEDRPRKQFPFSDEFISLAAWVMAEGWYRADDEAIMLGQSPTHNPDYCNYLEDLLLNFPGTISHEKGKDVRTWRIRQETAWALRHWMPDKIPSPAFIARMCNSNRRRFLYEFMRGDGSAGGNLPPPGSLTRARDFRPKGRTPVAFQKRPEAIDALQMMAALSGLRSTVKPRDCGGAFFSLLVHNEKINVARKEFRTITTDGVWCPTTERGTWVCRQNGQTLVTGNSDPADAFGYMLLGGGEGRMLLSGSSEPRKPIQTKVDYNPFDRRKAPVAVKDW